MKQLAYGCRLVDLDEYRAAFGARIIANECGDGYVGFVPGRTDWAGDDEADILQLDHWLQEEGGMDAIADAIRETHMPGSDRTAHVLVQDDHFGVVATASPQGSHGYLYLTVGLR